MSSQAAHISGQAFIQRTITNSPRSASRDGRKLVHRFMVGKPKIAPRSRSAKIPPVSITLRRRGQTFYYIPIPWGVKLSMNLSSPCVAFFSEPGLQAKLCRGKF